MVEGTVKRWDEDEGWGVLTSADVPGEVFAHFSHIDDEGYRSLADGEAIRFDWEHFPPGQDGYFYRATRIVRLTG
jgi:cold shock protein